MPAPKNNTMNELMRILALLDDAGKKTEKLADKVNPKKEESAMPKGKITLDAATAEKIKEFIKFGYRYPGYPDRGDPSDQKRYGYAHVGGDSCPNSARSTGRDEECQACQALVEVEEALAKLAPGADGELDLDTIASGQW